MDHKYENKVCSIAYVIIKSDFRLRCGRRSLFWAGWYTPQIVRSSYMALVVTYKLKENNSNRILTFKNKCAINWLGPALFTANTLVLRIARFCAKRFGQC